MVFKPNSPLDCGDAISARKKQKKRASIILVVFEKKHLKYVGEAGCSVRIPKQDGSGFESDGFSISSGTEVVPASREMFLTQRLGGDDASPRERSEVESPVKVVHRICDELGGKNRDAIIAKCLEEGVNINTAKTQFYRWRKENM